MHKNEFEYQNEEKETPEKNKQTEESERTRIHVNEIERIFAEIGRENLCIIPLTIAMVKGISLFLVCQPLSLVVGL